MLNSIRKMFRKLFRRPPPSKYDGPLRDYIVVEKRENEDTRLIRLDFEKVGQDLEEAIALYEEELRRDRERDRVDAHLGGGGRRS